MTGAVGISAQPVLTSEDALSDEWPSADQGVGEGVAAEDGRRTEVQYLSGKGPSDAVPWRFRCTEGRGCEDWTAIPVPSNWELEGFGRYDYGYRDDKQPESADYALSFAVPESWRGRAIELVFEGVMTDALVALDGETLGRHQGAFTPFSFDITSRIRFGEAQELTVRVDEGSANASVNRAERDADYWVFGGIYRPVYLAAHPPTHIEHLDLDARHDGALRLRAEVVAARSDGPMDVVAVVRAPDTGAALATLRGTASGDVASEGSEPMQSIWVEGKVDGVVPWSAENPVLYDLEVTLEQGGEPLHQLDRRIGFRTIEVRAGEGLFVNGNRILLKGVNRHSFWPTTGRALDAAQNRQDALLIKSLNANAVRASHYPPDRSFLDACDEIGLFVIDELPGWKEAFDTEVGTRLVTEMVRRDAHHPSIILWANGNEGGWNEALDGLYTQLDLARRPVIHPDEHFAGFDTVHYPTWAELRDRVGTAAGLGGWWQTLFGPNDGALVLPTEMLHGLYDGGGGAGLAEYWSLLSSSPRGAGGFLWALFDEGVVRVDEDGRIDTAGSDAPDGIVDPWRRPEPSAAVVRRVWSPVQIDERQLLDQSLPDVPPVEGQREQSSADPNEHSADQASSEDAFVTVEVDNRFDETDLATVRFHYRWLDIPAPGSAVPAPVRGEGWVSGGPTPPGTDGRLSIPRWAGAGQRVPDWLALSALDDHDRVLGSWSLPTRRQAVWVRDALVTARRQAARLPGASSPDRVRIEEEGDVIALHAGARFVRIDRQTGSLVSIGRGTQTLPISGGPWPLGARDGGAVLVDAGIDAGQAVVGIAREGGLGRVRWALDPSGWLRLSYQIDDRSDEPYVGVGFDLDAQAVGALERFGRPGRVWANRPSGEALVRHRIELDGADAWQAAAGYYAEPYWLRLETDAGALVIAVESDQVSLGVGVPAFPEDARTAVAAVPDPAMPGTSLSFMHRLPGIGTKFHRPRDLGPRTAVFPGLLRASLWLYIADE